MGNNVSSCWIDSIQISRGATITSDAVMLAIEREIEVLFMDVLEIQSDVFGVQNMVVFLLLGKDNLVLFTRTKP